MTVDVLGILDFSNLYPSSLFPTHYCYRDLHVVKSLPLDAKFFNNFKISWSNRLGSSSGAAYFRAQDSFHHTFPQVAPCMKSPPDMIRRGDDGTGILVQ